ncbi:unnamed protein product [Closterium sp. NIES-54]
MVAFTALPFQLASASFTVIVEMSQRCSGSACMSTSSSGSSSSSSASSYSRLDLHHIAVGILLGVSFIITGVTALNILLHYRRRPCRLLPCGRLPCRLPGRRLLLGRIRCCQLPCQLLHCWCLLCRLHQRRLHLLGLLLPGRRQVHSHADFHSVTSATGDAVRRRHRQRLTSPLIAGGRHQSQPTQVGHKGRGRGRGTRADVLGVLISKPIDLGEQRKRHRRGVSRRVDLRPPRRRPMLRLPHLQRHSFVEHHV